MSRSAKRAADRPDALPWEKRPLLRLSVVADLTGLSRATLYNLAAEGRLTFKMLAGCVVVETAGVRALVDAAEPWSPSNRGAAARAGSRAKRAEAARVALR